MRVAHVTYVHHAGDVRIFEKECRSLAAAGHDVHLLVPNPPAEKTSGVQFHALPPATQRTPWGRLRHWRNACDRTLRDLAPDIVHVHDPLLVSVALEAKARGARAIYDAHEEHVPHAWRMVHLPWGRRALLARAYGQAEEAARRGADLIIAATGTIADTFPAERTTTVHNFPIPQEFGHIAPLDVAARVGAGPASTAAYIGGLTRSRGLAQMLDAVGQAGPPIRLALAGQFDTPSTAETARRHASWNQVDDLGWLNRDGIQNLLARSLAGLVVLQPCPEFEMSWPVKMFEYMAAARPVIASDFPLWRTIIEDAGCGLLVDPTDSAAIAAALRRLTDDPAEARRLGLAGRAAVLDRYAWPHEAERLVAAYAELG